MPSLTKCISSILTSSTKATHIKLALRSNKKLRLLTVHQPVVRHALQLLNSPYNKHERHRLYGLHWPLLPQRTVAIQWLTAAGEGTPVTAAAKARRQYSGS